MRKLLLLGLAFSSSVSYAAPPAAPSDLKEAETLGSSAVAKAGDDLRQLLSTALKSGPASAIAACKVSAPGIGASDKRVTIGRSAQRLRNPGNTPRPWVEAAMVGIAASTAEKPAAPTTVHLGERRYGFIQPIYMQAMCLQCHGTSLAPGVDDRLKVEYPSDQAKNFALGSFRGVFWAEIDLAKP